ncbi:MAG TPA: PLP-dependent aminotransferase family protein [Mobilitalea sp.]|nr:PLP-dependent aminotransferase family protein [Mobilitalea sp.]
MDVLTPVLISESRIPLYHQLYSFIKEEIQSGRLAYNTKLPSKRKLSAYLNISQNTIQAAYDQLIEEGYVAPSERRGFYVCKIDHVQRLKITPVKEELKIKKELPEVTYDFSYHGVDIPSFPFTIWRKLYKDVINEYDHELLSMGDSMGYRPLRAAISKYLHQSRGVSCTESQIVISSGTEILFQSLIQLFDKGSIYGIENPGYEKLNQLFTSNCAQFKPIEIDRSGMIPEKINNSNATILCITPAHQFPSGEIMPINRRNQLLNWANEASGRYLIEDDYDSEFKYSGKPIPALQGLDMNEKVIFMGSLSKSLSPTIRVSYMVLPPHLIKKYNEQLSFILCPVPVIDQKVLCRFIEDGYFERHLNRMRSIYKKKREILVKAIYDLKCGIDIIGADAGLHLLLSVPNGIPEEELIASALRNGVKVYGVSKYYFDKCCYTLHPRILLGYAALTEEEITQAVKLLHQAWFHI